MPVLPIALLGGAALGTMALLAVAVAAVAQLAGAPATPGLAADDTLPAASTARLDIPPRYLVLYRAAAAQYGLDWTVLAAVGRVECDHGRDPDPSCTREGSVNYAGAGGPMQFLASTWARYGVDGNGDGRADRWDASDAIYSAANYLRAAGAPGDYRRALLSYNDAGWYVDEVERWAARYRSAVAASVAAAGPESVAEPRLQAATSTPVELIAGARAVLAPGDGHVALIPAEAPASVQAMIVAGNELQDLPYGPDGHPDPRGAPDQDCSSSTSYVLYRAGVRPIADIVHSNPLAQDYVHWGDPGPGRWVTIYATDLPTPHVFMVIAGLRLDTSHGGTDVGPNRFEDGPRWRILDRLPGWAQWSVRHPPGL